MNCPHCLADDITDEHLARCELQEIKQKKIDEGLCYCFENKVLAISFGDNTPEKCIFCLSGSDADSDWKNDLIADDAYRRGRN